MKDGKNTEQILTLCALSDLWIAQRTLLPNTGHVWQRSGKSMSLLSGTDGLFALQRSFVQAHRFGEVWACLRRPRAVMHNYGLQTVARSRFTRRPNKVLWY